MKSLILFAMVTFSFSSFATSLEEAVNKVEVNKNAKCTYVSSSKVSMCLGMPKTCYYNVKFKCESNEGVFGLKVKMKESYSFDRPGFVTSVSQNYHH